ncbi:fructose-1,6-bisphosphatase, class II [Peptostreptococcaceae bacterium oral taxon 113 str. W5053]|nr:fructose-1,6-bisphosphatase, class II [Peptostreptococcaceae bacterium oral taxon 113 str. W5053]
MDRNLTLNLVRVTEVAAIQSAKFLGRGDKNAVDEAAVEGMREMFDDLDIDGIVVIGEGEMDEAPMLYIGEQIGKAGENSVKVDIAVDPVDGTELVAKGLENAIAVVAVAPRGDLFHAPDMYMHKLAAGPKAKDAVHMDLPIEVNLRRLAKALNKEVSELTVSMLDRPRHAELIRRVRATGARIKLFRAGDIAAAIATCYKDSGVDLLIGSGGAPEGVIAAVAIKALGGVFQARLDPHTEEEIRRCKEMGIEDVDRILEISDLVKGEDALFAATGVTDGDLMPGVVNLGNNRVRTSSLVLRVQTGTARKIEAVHILTRKPEYFQK